MTRWRFYCVAFGTLSSLSAICRPALAVDINDLFSDKKGFSISNGAAAFDGDEKANWKNIEISKSGATFEHKKREPQTDIGGDQNFQRLKIEYADFEKKTIGRITRVRDVFRNNFAYAQSLDAETVKFVNGVPTSFTSCSVFKRQDFRESGRTYPHEIAIDIAAGVVGSKSDVDVRADCDRVDDKICKSLRVWSAAQDDKQIERCFDSLKSLRELTASDEEGKAERKVVLDEFKKMNNSTNPLINRKLAYTNDMLDNAFNAKKAKSEFASMVIRIASMLRACDSLGLPAKSNSTVNETSGARIKK